MQDNKKSKTNSANGLHYNQIENKYQTASILLIGRYGFDARNLCYSKDFNYDEKSGKIYSSKFGSRVKLQFLTAHSSKGLSAENVIIINAKDEIYGFPSKIEDDPILDLVVSNDNSYNYAEERRLFYVALTRTKNRVFIITPEQRPSEFIKELLREPTLYPNVTLKGELKSDLASIGNIKERCPICGYPMQLRWNKNYGLRLWICTNDQEICGFMTNDKRGERLSIHKCDWCQDGYLVVKKGERSYFLGCTNYKADKSGCNRMLNYEHYDAWLNNNFGINDSSIDKPSFLAHHEKQETIPLPKNIQPQKPIIVQVRKNTPVHTIKYELRMIEKDGFKVLVDTNDNIVTDMVLLQKLRVIRNQLAKNMNCPAFHIMHNSALARLATDKPTSREEFISIPGLGNKKYKHYGDIFIDAIKLHIESIS